MDAHKFEQFFQHSDILAALFLIFSFLLFLLGLCFVDLLLDFDVGENLASGSKID
jgi:hypothetical protein